jgi:XcyI restriction endonuclease
MPTNIQTWTLDQLAKSSFFHRKLHEWKLLEVAEQIEQIHGETLNWSDLNISEQAWNKIIHRGIMPIIVFAHPQVLTDISGAVAHYRMLSMVSQKSMKQVGINLDSYETGKPISDRALATLIAQHLNHIISTLIEDDETINVREFDLWRGMAAGSQAQGSWQNNKGTVAEIAIRGIILTRLLQQEISIHEQSANRIDLGEGRVLVFAAEPDIAIYKNGIPEVVVEIKGGIDPAGVLERVGAALKSLRRARQENPSAVTILILQDASLTDRARTDLEINVEIVTHLFSAESITENETERERFFQQLKI